MQAYRLLQFHCTGVQLVVLALLRDQLVMRTTLDDVAVVEHHDHIGIAHGGQAVGDDEDRTGDLLEAAKENVRIEREKTMKDLQTQIAGLAMASAEKIVGDKEQNIYDQFLGEVGGTDEDTDK